MLAIFNRKIGSKMTFDFEDPGNPADKLKNFNLFYLSHALTTIYIIKVCFPANTDNSGYGNDNLFEKICDTTFSQP